MNIEKWKKKLSNDLYKNTSYSSANIDTDHPRCPECGKKMDFYGHDDDGDFPIGEGYWECSYCGFKIKESEI